MKDPFRELTSYEVTEYLGTSRAAWLARGAWFGDPDIKEAVLAKLKEHRAQDEITQGLYQGFGFNHETRDTSFRGCALGCMLPPRPHLRAYHLKTAPVYRLVHSSEVELRFGIDEGVARRIDTTFESQDTFEAAANFAVASVEVIPVGANLEGFGYDMNLYLAARGHEWPNYPPSAEVRAAAFFHAAAIAPIVEVQS